VARSARKRIEQRSNRIHFMTPAIKLLQQHKIPHTVREYEHDPAAESFGREAAAKLGVTEARVFKTLVVTLDGKELAVGVIPVSALLSMKAFARAAGGKKADMAAPKDVERTTGYVLGGVSPLGQKKKLKTVIDASALQFPTVYISGGRRGLDIELSPQQLATLLNAAFAEISQ
jgi:Cys-tRNA(Pro)/Cys-tRNA(Cys) deacylase